MKNRAFLRHIRAMTDTANVRPDFGLFIVDVGTENAFVRATSPRELSPTVLSMVGRAARISRFNTVAEDFSILRGAAFRLGVDDLAVELI